MTVQTELDHIVVGCRSLDEGRVWCRETFGVEASGGGKHAGIGTHNTLLSLGSRCYLEIIAIDPDATPPAFPRWFGLDTDEVSDALAHGPRLIGWVARVARGGQDRDMIDRIASVPGNDASVVRAAERDDFRWRFAFTRDGARPRKGVLPHFIQWDVAIHPCDRLPQSDVQLNALLLGDPTPEALTQVLTAVRFSDSSVHVAQSASANLVATLSSSNGQVVLD